VVAVVGPTASGKTELAVALAEQLQGELLSADSRQIFRDCDIGTNKPTLVELRDIPCHLLDMVQPGDHFTVADYREAALAEVDRITGRGHLSIFQGGTGLYLRAVFEGWNLAGAPPDPQTRAALELRLEDEGVEALQAELRQIDPAAADRTQGNPRRIIRALEIHAVTGQPPTLARKASPPSWHRVVLGLEVSLDELDARIATRVDRMLAAGWLDEVKTIRSRYAKADLRLLGHGYPELTEHLEGTRSIEDARASIVRQVRQYARRQLTWFRADPQVQWIAPDLGEALRRIRLGIMKKEAS
jgi:tRNA dimethylallyltransferase